MKRHLHMATHNGQRVLRAVQRGTKRPVINRYYYAASDTWAFKMTHSTTVERATHAAFKKVLAGEAKWAEIHDEQDRLAVVIRRHRNKIHVEPQ